MPVTRIEFWQNGQGFGVEKWGIERGSSRRTFYPVEAPFNIRLVGDYIKVQKDFDLIECFTTTFLRAHSWLWVDEDDDEHDGLA